MTAALARALVLSGTAMAAVSWAGPGVEFANVAAAAGISFRHVNGATGKKHFIETMGPGCAFVDYDSDGWLDVYMVNGHALEGTEQPLAGNALYRNRGDGTFVDVTRQSGTGDTGYGMGITAADYDNDGDLDLYISNYGPNVLYRNNGDGTFIDVTDSAGVGDDRWGVGCTFLDYDNDGLLDLYVANYVDFSLQDAKTAMAPYMPRSPGRQTMATARGYPHPDNYSGVPDVLYRNRGDGTFADVTRAAGVYNPEGKGMGMACGDYDNDGDPDIYVGNDLTPNFLYQNNGDGTFTDVALLAGVAYNRDGRTESSMGIDFGDYDRDGHLDLIVPNFQGETATVYRNAGNGFFADVSTACGVGLPTHAFVGWGVGFLDYDNDGELDLFISTGHVLDNVELFDARTTYAQRNFLFRNNGSARGGGPAFSDVSALAGEGLAEMRGSRGAAFGDYDNDGDTDILIVNCNDATTLLRNEGRKQSHWLQVRTRGKESNRSGIGARLELASADLVQIREVKGGSSLYSQCDLRVSFGLGHRDSADRLVVRWPSGTVDVLSDLPVDTCITVGEGLGVVAACAP